jgi:hypothetical protein
MRSLKAVSSYLILALDQASSEATRLNMLKFDVMRYVAK